MLGLTANQLCIMLPTCDQVSPFGRSSPSFLSCLALIIPFPISIAFFFQSSSLKDLDVSIDELVFGAVSERMEKNISDQELLSMFQKIQKLEQQQLNTVKDFISAYLLKADLQKNLAGSK